jgi:hypothetical protein
MRSFVFVALVELEKLMRIVVMMVVVAQMMPAER